MYFDHPMYHRKYLPCAFLILLVGCADDGRVPTFQAGGIVRFADGKPLPGGAILCESPHGLAARAMINDDGTFQLGTYESADGAVAGKHRAAIRPPTTGDFDPDSGRPSMASLIDDRYLSMDTSGIELEVSADGDNHFEIVVERPTKKR
jgi:hypothetical protein